MARDLNVVPEALTNFDSLPDSANVRVAVVAALAGYSKATVWRKAKAGKLPAPRRVSDRVTVWNVGELRAFLNAVA